MKYHRLGFEVNLYLFCHFLEVFLINQRTVKCSNNISDNHACIKIIADSLLKALVEAAVTVTSI